MDVDPLVLPTDEGKKLATLLSTPKD